MSRVAYYAMVTTLSLVIGKRRNKGMVLKIEALIIFEGPLILHMIHPPGKTRPDLLAEGRFG